VGYKEWGSGTAHAICGYVAKINSYKDLEVWQRAMTLAESVYKWTETFPDSERFGLAAQLRRSSVSIPSNIAEGHCRRFTLVYINHVSIALGSQAELETQVELAKRLHYGRAEQRGKVEELAFEVGRMLNGLARSLEIRAEARLHAPRRRMPIPNVQPRPGSSL
jgi:four helix bundle protein